MGVNFDDCRCKWGRGVEDVVVEGSGSVTLNLICEPVDGTGLVVATVEGQWNSCIFGVGAFGKSG